MSEVVTQLTIDADTAGADRFSQAMDNAGSSARGAVADTRDLALSVAGVGVAFVGMLVTANQGLNYIVGLNKGLADLQTMAKQVGLSLTDIQGIQFGGQIAGLTTDQINTGLQKSASLLNDASRNANTLSKELAENGISLKNANGQLISQNQLLGVAADLIKRAKDPGDQLAIAQMLGFTKEWIPLLEQGAGAMSGLSAEAMRVGAVIDDETIHRATEFDTQWRKSSVEFSSYMKAALSGLLPYLDDLINGAQKFIKGINVADIERFANDQLKELADPLGLPDAIALKITIPQNVIDKWDQLKVKVDEAFVSLSSMANNPKITGMFEAWKAAVPAAVGSLVAGPLKNLTNVEFVDPKWYGVGTSGIDDTSTANLRAAIQAKGATDAWIAESAAIKKLSTESLAGADAVGNFSKVAKKDTNAGRDTLETEIDRLTKHIAITKADAESVGQSEAARAGLRAEATLYAAAERAGFTDLEQYADKFMKIREQVEATTAALAQAKAGSDAKFNLDTVGLSDAEKQIASINRQLHGDDWKQYTDDALSNTIRLTNGIKDIKSGFDDVGKAVFSAFLSGKNVMDAMVQSLDNVAKKLADKAFENILSGALSGDPIQMAVGAAQAGASALITAFTGDQKAKKELQAAQDAWAKMADQVVAFNRAAAGFTLGPLTQQLQALSASVDTLMAAAVKAKDAAGAAKLGDTFNKGAARLVDEFKAGAVTLSPLQTAIKGVNDEYKGLYETLTSLHLDSLTIGLAESAQAQIRNLIAQYTDQLNASLADRLNVANGKPYLNSAAALQKQHAADLAAAGELGNDPAVLAQISAVFHAEAQKIVEDAGLVGAGFSDFINLFPDFSGVVTQSATALAAASDKFNALTKTIDDYLDSLKLGANSTLSPTDQLAEAQNQFNRQITLAQQGNADALGSITQYAGTLLTQAKSYYASSSGYGDIYSATTSALKGLTGMAGGGIVRSYADGGVVGNGMFGVDSVIAKFAGGGNIGLAGGEFVMPAAQTQAHLPMLEAMRSGSAANDNGKYFSALGQQLVRAMAGISMGEITAIREENALLRAQVGQLIAAVKDKSKPSAVRPSEKAA